jgi:hypothetical protein
MGRRKEEREGRTEGRKGRKEIPEELLPNSFKA